MATDSWIPSGSVGLGRWRVVLRLQRVVGGLMCLRLDLLESAVHAADGQHLFYKKGGEDDYVLTTAETPLFAQNDLGPCSWGTSVRGVKIHDPRMYVPGPIVIGTGFVRTL